MSNDDPDDRDANRPTTEITNHGDGKWSASGVLDSRISTSHLLAPESAASIAEGEFLDVEEELKATLGDGESAKDRGIRVSAVSFPGDRDGDLVVQSTLLIELMRCDATDPQCSDMIGLIIRDAVAELRKALAAELQRYSEG